MSFVTLLSFNSSAQIDPIPRDSFDCAEFLKKLSPAMKWDTLGREGIKLFATKQIFKNKCPVVGQHISYFIDLYGYSDTDFEWGGERRNAERVHTYKYKLHTSTFDDIYTFGDSWFYITTDASGIIRYAVIHTIDE